MEGIQSWSTFEQQHHQSNNHNTSSIGYPPSSGTPPSSVNKGIEALYVSSSSADIAPATASLLRHSGLTTTTPNNNNNSKRSLGNIAEDVGFESQQGDEEEEEEFRLRFHWMRPHPSLAFALEEELASSSVSSSALSERVGQGAETNNLNGCIKSDPEGGRKTPNDKSTKQQKMNPAIESAKIMEAYRSSQLKKTLNITTNGTNSDEGDSETLNVTESAPTSRNLQHLEEETPNLPLELPKLRINLASLVDPPLMSSWFPGEDMCIDSDSDDEEDDNDDDDNDNMDK